MLRASLKLLQQHTRLRLLAEDILLLAVLLILFGGHVHVSFHGLLDPTRIFPLALSHPISLSVCDLSTRFIY